MEALNNIREAIEALAGEEKIDDGNYLVLMNHLKTVYGAVSKDQEVMPVRRDVVRRDEEDDYFRELHERYFTSIYCRVARDEMWNSPRAVITRPQDNQLFAGLFDSVMTGMGGEMAFSAMWEANNSDRGNHMLYHINRKEMWDRMWKSLDMRDKFISIPCVRKSIINQHVIRWHCLQSLICPQYGGTYVPYDSDAYWMKMLIHVNLPFQYGLKWVDGKTNNFDTEPLTEDKLKKLHRVRITFHMNNNDDIHMELYTDKIQLGRTACVDSMLRMKHVLAILHPELNTQIDTLLWKRRNQKRNGYTCPRLAVSGITANTRSKSRTYTWQNDFTITYLSNMNNGNE